MKPVLGKQPDAQATARHDEHFHRLASILDSALSEQDYCRQSLDVRRSLRRDRVNVSALCKKSCGSALAFMAWMEGIHGS